MIMIAPEQGQGGITMELAVDDVKVERYTEWTEPPARPKPTENVTYDFSQMTKSGGYDCTTTVAGSALKISYAKQYGEAQYSLPQGMFTDDYDRIVVHMSECTGTIDFKIMAGGKNILDNYGKDGTCILDLSSVPGYEVTTIGIMQDSTGTCNAVIEGFTFVVAGTEYELQAEPPKAPGELQEDALVYAATDFESESLIGGYGYTKEAAEHDGLKVTLSDAGYQEIQFNLPEAVAAGAYEKMVVTVSSTTNAFAVKAGGKDWYNNSATTTTDLVFDLAEVTSDITQVGLMAGASTGTEFVVYRIAFLPKQAQEEGVKTTYTFKELTQTQIWDATSSVDASTGAITMSFPATYKQVFFAIPADIDVTKLESITFNGLVGSSYALKLQTQAEYDKYDGNAAITGYDNPTIATGGSEVKYFVFMSNDSNATADAPQVITVESVTFNLAEEEKITEFYIATDVAFTNVDVLNDGNGNVNASLPDLYLDSDNFKNKLPDELKADETIANKFTTLEGIVEMVDYFEVEVTLTDATAASEDIAGYAPQAQVYIQSSDWGSGTWGQVIGNIGQPSEGNPKTGTFEHSTDLIASWTSPTIAKIGIQIINALEGTQVSGTYTVKVVLK